MRLLRTSYAFDTCAGKREYYGETFELFKLTARLCIVVGSRRSSNEISRYYFPILCRGVSICKFVETNLERLRWNKSSSIDFYVLYELSTTRLHGFSNRTRATFFIPFVSTLKFEEKNLEHTDINRVD